jgi:predicted solute-binding protein
MRHLSDISAEASASLNLPPNKLQRYLTENINFSLDDENLRGLTSFFTMAAELNLIPRAKPLEFAAPRADRQRDTATAAYAKPR